MANPSGLSGLSFNAPPFVPGNDDNTQSSQPGSSPTNESSPDLRQRFNAQVPVGSGSLHGRRISQHDSSSLTTDDQTLSLQIKSFLKESNYTAAYEIYKEFRGRGKFPGPLACNELVIKLANQGFLLEADTIQKAMFEGNISLNTEAYTTIIKAHTALGEYDKCVSLFTDMMEQEVLPNLQTFNALISVCGRVKNLQHSVELFDQMSPLGIQADTTTINMMLAQCSKERDIPKLEQYYGLMGPSNIKPNLETYNLMVAAYNHVKRLDDAERMFNEMRKMGFDPGTQAFTSMVATHRNATNTQKVSKYQELAKRLGVTLPATQRGPVPASMNTRTCRICREEVADIRKHLNASHPRPNTRFDLNLEPQDADTHSSSLPHQRRTIPDRHLETCTRKRAQEWMIDTVPNALESYDPLRDPFNVYNGRRVIAEGSEFSEDAVLRVHKLGTLKKICWISKEALEKLVDLCKKNEPYWNEARMYNHLNYSWMRSIEQGKVLCIQEGSDPEELSYPKTAQTKEFRTKGLTRSFCIFNTGLREGLSQKDILAIFVAQPVQKHAYRLTANNIWTSNSSEFRTVAKTAIMQPEDRLLIRGHAKINEKGNLKVLPPTYFKPGDPRQLFDWTAKLQLGAMHIVHDNCKRFTDAGVLDQDEVNFDSSGRPNWSRGQAGFDAAVESLGVWTRRSVKHAKRQYNLVLPMMYYTPRVNGYYLGSFQLLLPLFCERGDPMPKLGLALTPIIDPESNNLERYEASTILTSIMAFSNVRLVTSPEAKWITDLPEEGEEIPETEETSGAPNS